MEIIAIANHTRSIQTVQDKNQPHLVKNNVLMDTKDLLIKMIYIMVNPLTLYTELEIYKSKLCKTDLLKDLSQYMKISIIIKKEFMFIKLVKTLVDMQSKYLDGELRMELLIG